ncbi:MAG: sugar phosphate isomerase/epimerase family protein [Phycisphaerales bacterium]
MTARLFASSPWGFRQTPLAGQCRWLKDHGFKHICGQIFEGAAGMFQPGITDAQIEAAKKLVAGYGLKYASFNAGGDYMVKQNLDKEIATARQCIDTAAKFKAQAIIVFAGWQPREDEAVYDQVATSIKSVARHAASYGLTVALENHGGLTATPAQVDRLIRAVGEPNLGVNYDPANFEMYGYDPLKALKEMTSPVVFTHFKSVKRDAAGKKVYCRLKDGYIDYAPIVDALIARGYEGFWAIEYEEPSDVEQGSADDLKSLNQLLNKHAPAKAAR